MKFGYFLSFKKSQYILWTIVLKIVRLSENGKVLFLFIKIILEMFSEQSEFKNHKHVFLTEIQICHTQYSQKGVAKWHSKITRMNISVQSVRKIN